MAEQFIGMANMCKYMQALPYPGGLLDQDHMFVILLDWITEANTVKEELERQEQQRRNRHNTRR